MLKDGRTLTVTTRVWLIPITWPPWRPGGYNKHSMSTNAQTLTGRTILIAPHTTQPDDLTAQLERLGARVITCPRPEISGPEIYAPIDEAIENLYGYDWLIFAGVPAVEHFLLRLQHLAHEIADLDRLRICAIGELTARLLATSHVHIDLICEQKRSNEIAHALERFADAPSGLRGLNILIPRAAISRDRLPTLLEEAGARVDVVAAYRTVTTERQQLARIPTLLAGGGVDCVVFPNASAVYDFAQVLDVQDLSDLLSNIAVACADEATGAAVVEFGLKCGISAIDSRSGALAGAIAVNLLR